MQRFKRFVTVLSLTTALLTSGMIPAAHAVVIRPQNMFLNCRGAGSASMSVVMVFENSTQRFTNYCDPGGGAKYAWPVMSPVFGKLLHVYGSVLVQNLSGVQEQLCPIGGQQGHLYGFCSATLMIQAAQTVEVEYGISVAAPNPALPNGY